MFRVLALILILVMPLAGSGCAIVEVGVRNPVVGLETVAIAPFFNLSQERTVDGREFALDYYAELQKVPGFEVLPVGVTERAMVENGISLAGPEDAVRLAKILDVDAVVVGAVTDYDPYNPRIGLKVAWYSPRQWLFLPNEDPNVPAFNRSADAPVKRPGRPSYGTPRAQSPDDSDEWESASSDVPVDVEDGNWESVTAPVKSSGMLLADTGSRQNQPVLPAGTSLLVPIQPMNVPPVPTDNRSSRRYPVASSQSLERPASLVPAPPAETITLVQGNVTELPVPLPSSPLAQPITQPLDARPNAGVPVPQLNGTATISPPAELPQRPDAGSKELIPEPFRQPESKKPIRKPIANSLADDNPFDRHLAEPGSVSEVPEGAQQFIPEIADQPKYLTPPRIADAEPEFPGGSEPASQLPPMPSAPPAAEPPPKPAGPVLKTPLFPVFHPDSSAVMQSEPLSTRASALIYGEQVLMPPSEFDSTEPLMAYVRLFDATDRRLIARLSDYLELTGQLQSGDLEAYMKRSEFFRKFTAHVMISEMLQLHGGEARRQLVLKARQYR